MPSRLPEYYKRVNTYAHFTCTQGVELYALCNEVVATGERLEASIVIIVTAPEEFGDEPVAKITQVISLKNLGSSEKRSLQS